MFVMKNGRNWNIFFHILHEKNLLLILYSGAWFLQLVLHKSHTKAQRPYERRELTALDAELYSDAMTLMTKEAASNILDILQDLLISKLAG